MLTTADIEQRLASYDATHGVTVSKYMPGGGFVTRMFYMLHFQCSLCYICAQSFGIEYRKMSRDHVKPKSAGGGNRGNILLACQPCNNAKGNRAPTPRERKLLTLFNRGMRVEFHLLLHTNTPPVVRRNPSKRQRERAANLRAERMIQAGLGFPNDTPDQP